MLVAIHQPNFFPWLGFFDKMKSVDLFIVMDEVQLADRGYTTRCRMLNANGEPVWISVPVEKHGHREKTIKDIRLNQGIDWKKKHLDFFRGTYQSFSHYEETMSIIKPIYEKHYEWLVELNMDAITAVKNTLGIHTEFVYQSDLDYDRNKYKSDLILELCKCVGADSYLSGRGAGSYMELDDFENQNIKVRFQEFLHPEYIQEKREEFLPGLSILDLLLQTGIDKAREILVGV